MKLEKDGIVYEIENPIQVKAFLDSGYAEVKEEKPSKKSK